MDTAAIIAALAGAPRQNNRLLHLHTTAGPNALVAETLDGIEAVDNGGYRFELTALSASAHINLAQMLDTPALLQLLTAKSRIHLRPFHGHVTAIERAGSNAGLARYKLRIEPWLSYLGHRTDSVVYPDQTVIEIVENIFANYGTSGAEQGSAQTSIAPAWRWDLADASIYRRRSVTTHYNETDHYFVSRLLAEEGLFYWFEHDGDITSPAFGRHTLVIADHNGAFTPSDGAGEAIAYHRAAATESRDTIQGWQHVRRMRTATVAHASWNYRSRRQETVYAGVSRPDPVVIADADPAGAYAWHDSSEGARRAQQHLDAINVNSDLYHAESGGRHLAPGQRFMLTGHADFAAVDDTGAAQNRFICLRVHHHARNNLGADIQSFVEQQLGRTHGAPALPDAFRYRPDVDPGGSRDAARAGRSDIHAVRDNRSGGSNDNGVLHDGETDFYRNEIKALAAATPYRPATAAGHGQRRQPKPVVHGAQTAIVVGHHNQPSHTDRDHRVRIQYHWQRGSQSASGQARPNGADNASAQPAPTGAWVRVVSPLVGENHGGVMLPRVGQEVLVDFIEGDIDRPVIVASLYNGQGNEDAPHNKVPHGGSRATGNAPAWFAGNEHEAVYSGIKTQAMASSRTGTGGFNMLRFDDTPAEAKLQLATTQHQSGLHLGHLKAGEDNLRTANRGYGVELTTEQSGAIRAGAGLLITTEASLNQMAATTLQATLNQAYSLTTSLTATAQNQQTKLPKEPEPKQLKAAKALEHTDDLLNATSIGTEPASGIGGGAGEVPVFGEPLLAISGMDGIGLYTPETQVWVAGEQTSLTAAQDISVIAQGSTTIAVKNGASLFTCGETANDSRPINQTGIKLHAATGEVTLEATTGKADFSAEKKTTMASTNASLTASAKTKLLATATGAYLKLEGGHIELGAPGQIKFNAAQKIVTGPKSAKPVSVPLSSSRLKGCELWAEQGERRGSGIVELS